MSRFLSTKHPGADRLELVKKSVGEHWFAILLLVPSLLFLVFLMWLPFLRGIWMSFHYWPFIGEPTFVGLENYRYLAQWDAFYTSVKATIVFGTQIFFQLGIALLAALVVTNMEYFSNVVSGLFLLPYVLPPVVSGTLWLLILNPNFGPFFEVLKTLNLIEGSVAWSSSGDLSLLVITAVSAWTFWPFMFIILLASLSRIPEEYFEAAEIYGASKWQKFWKVTVPEIRSAILLVVALRIIWNFSKVSQPLQLTGGGPGYDSSVLGILLYRLGLQSGRFGLANAIGLVLLAISLVFSALFIRKYDLGGKIA